MSNRTINNLARSLVRILVLGGIDRQVLASALDKEARLTGGLSEDILERFIADIDSLNSDSFRKQLESELKDGR